MSDEKDAKNLTKEELEKIQGGITLDNGIKKGITLDNGIKKGPAVKGMERVFDDE